MASKEFDGRLTKILSLISGAREARIANEFNEEWTKVNLILPLLEALGWDTATDIHYENCPDDSEGRLDFVLNCQSKSMVGVEAKALEVSRPADTGHKYIKKGVKQSNERGASCFIWTNGDCWMFASDALPNAPLYEIILSTTAVGVIAARFSMIEKRRIVDNPASIEEAIRQNWKMKELATASGRVLETYPADMARLIRNVLPDDLKKLDDQEILEFLQTPKSSTESEMVEHRGSAASERREVPSSLEAWQTFLDSYETDLKNDRMRFRTGYDYHLGSFLISEKYHPWRKAQKLTWRLANIPDNPKDKKKGGSVIALFKKWGFIRETERGYERVDAAIPYLKKLLEG